MKLNSLSATCLVAAGTATSSTTRTTVSRTKKKSKPPGWDYWGKRPIGDGANGTKNKRAGIKKERAIEKRKLRKEKDEE
jgi:hypothetical protein